MRFCPFRAYWIISSEQVNIVLVVFFTCPNVVMDNQQETFPRRSVLHSCFPCSNPWFAWASKRRCPGEALFIVVSLAQPLVSMGLEEAMSPRSCSITWHSFSPWHNLSKLSFSSWFTEKVVFCCLACSRIATRSV